MTELFQNRRQPHKIDDTLTKLTTQFDKIDDTLTKFTTHWQNLPDIDKIDD